MIRIGGQTLYEMSETQLKNLLPEYETKPEVKSEIIRLIQTKSRIRNSEARDRHKADPDFVKNNF